MAVFTAVQSGAWADGATWGNTSPGVPGTDYPALGDTANITGYNVTVVGNQACSGGTIGSGGTLTLSANSYLNSDTGDLYFSAGSSALTLAEGAELEFTNGANLDATNGTFTAIGTASNRCKVHGGTGSRFAAITSTVRAGSFNFYFTDLIFNDYSIGKENIFPQTPVNMIFEDCVVVANGGDIILGGTGHQPETVRMLRSDFRWPSADSLLFITLASHIATEKTISKCTFVTDDEGFARCAIRVNNADVSECVTKNVKMEQDSNYYGVQYDKCYGFWDDGSEFVADGPFKGRTISTGSRGYKLSNSVMWNNATNAHFMGASVIDSVGAFTNEASDNFIETEGSGGCNFYIFGRQAVDILRNVIVGNIINVAGVADQTTGVTGQSVAVQKNTVVETGATAAVDALLLFEGDANPIYTGTVNVDDNLVKNTTTPTGLISRSEYNGGGTSQQNVTTARNNFATATALVDDGLNGQTVIATETGNNLSYSATFVDNTRRIGSYGSTFHGTDGSTNAMTAKALLINGFDSVNNTQVVGDKSGVDVTTMNTWLRAGFAPTDQTLATAGYDGGIVGALAPQSGPIPFAGRFPVGDFLNVGYDAVAPQHIKKITIKKEST